jgi:hypothetical protein
MVYVMPLCYSILLISVEVCQIQRLLSTDDSETGSPSSASDFYFDDEISARPLQDQERHLRLEATIGLDNQSNLDLSNSLFQSPYVIVKDRAKASKAQARHLLIPATATNGINSSVMEGERKNIQDLKHCETLTGSILFFLYHGKTAYCSSSAECEILPVMAD